MKNLSTSAAIAITSATLLANPAEARNLVVGLTAPTQRGSAQSIATEIAKGIVHTVQPGEKADLFDLSSNRLICTVRVPPGTAFGSDKAKVMSNRPCFAQLFALMSRGNNRPGMRLPEFTRTLGENYPASKLTDVVVLGSPIYDEPSEPGFSMKGGLIPGDGNITAPTTRSPYGTADRKGLLRNFRFHFGYYDQNWRLNDQHEQYVRRFWTLELGSQDGQVVTFTGDLNTLFNKVMTGQIGPRPSYKLIPTDKLEMMRIRREAPTQGELFQRSVSVSRLRPEQIAAARNTEIGITWDCPDADVDLYVRPAPDAETLYFGKTQTVAGSFFKDIRFSPAKSKGLETVELRAIVDLRRVFLAVNFYDGTCPSARINGELRLSTAGSTFSTRFTILSRSGNSAAGARDVLSTGRAPNVNWTVIPITSVIGAP